MLPLPESCCPRRSALAAANATQTDIAAVSVHGTGTPLGDPIEIGALGQGLKRAAGDTGNILLLSNKACFGHTEGTAGLSGAKHTIFASNVLRSIISKRGLS